MPCPLVPARVRENIFDLKPDALKAAGVTLVLADLDNTLVPYEQTGPDDRVRRWKDALEAAGVRLFVVSNNRKGWRVPTYCDDLGIPYVRHAGKPGTSGYLKAMEAAGAAPGETLMVGDQIFTDIWGANRAGVRAVLVKPIAIGKNPLRAVRYAAETPFRLAGRRKGRPSPSPASPEPPPPEGEAQRKRGISPSPASPEPPPPEGEAQRK